MNDRLDIVEGDLSIRGGRIAAVGPNVSGHHDRTIDAGGGYILAPSNHLQADVPAENVVTLFETAHTVPKA